MIIRSYRKLPAAHALGEEWRTLQALEQGDCGEDRCESLLLWEAGSPCIVLPRSGLAAKELRDPENLTIPVLRRESGGGAVVLGRGCLNYALVLSLERRPALLDVEHSYGAILGGLSSALGLTGVRAIGSDLALGDCKIGGHAQRRTRRALLHHGTILYDFEIGQVGRALREPERQPSYRRRRTHDQFLVNAPIGLDDLLACLIGWASSVDAPRGARTQPSAAE